MAKLSEKQESLLKELIDDLNGDTEALMGRDGIMNELRKRLIENMLDGEMTDHLGYAPHDPTGNGSGNSRNGRSSKKIQSKDGDIPLDIPRDRNATFEPQVVKKGQRRIDGIDDLIISLYARAAQMPVHILLSKADKLKKGPAGNSLLNTRARLADHAGLVSVQLFSALRGTGLDELHEVLDHWLTDTGVPEGIGIRK